MRGPRATLPARGFDLFTEVSVFKVHFGGMEWQQRREGVRDKHRAVSIVPGTSLLMVEDA